MIGRNDPCWCGSEKKWKKCHYPEKGSVDKKSLSHEYKVKHNIRIKNEKEINGIRQAGHLAAKILEELCEMAKAGVTTAQLDAKARVLCKKAGALPAPLNYGYPPFPGAICTSINEVICHGIPNETILVDGDIINIDVTVILNSYYGDCSKMVIIGGETSEERALVTETAYECLMRSIAILKPGVTVSAIGDSIVDYAEGLGCSVVNQFVGHGVGCDFHEEPQIPHHRNQCRIKLVPGMTFTIEPMINAGARGAIIDPKDQWVARTEDGRASGQWEHTLVITDTGYEILTPWTK
jgi:methionyl aminopeptidase